MKVLRMIGLLLMSFGVSLPVIGSEDIDIFQYPKVESKQKPNVLILLDNTANWNTPFSQEKTALTTVVSGLTDQFRVGLMMFTETGSPNDNVDGGYVRFGIRDMDATNKAALVSMVTNLHVLNDKSNGGKAGLTMAEAWYYYAGLNSRSGKGKIKRDAAGNSIANNPASVLSGNPFSSMAATKYSSPVLDLNCQQNYIIYISNGAVQDNNSDTSTATTLLSTEGGNTTQIGLSPSGSQTNVADEWSRFMFGNTKTDKPKIITYTIDVNKLTTGQGPGWTALLKSMAKQGGGTYFDVNANEVVDALKEIFARIQAVDSVFASVTLPVSVNVRGTYLNQVYMGVFRPDGSAKPRWPGNLKLYQLGLDTTDNTAFLADALGKPAEDKSTGFITTTAKSFWTKDSSFWGFKYPVASDNPDGSTVEKGGAAQMLRTDYATSQSARTLYTCTGSCATLSNFNTGNPSLTSAAFDGEDPAKVIPWVRGQDNIEDENQNSSSTDVRASIHGDVLHSRPAVINYGDSRGIVVYYGANDGVFHAVKGGTSGTGVGSEMWGMVFQEHYKSLARIYKNDPEISTSNPKPYFADGAVGTYALDSNNDGVLEKAYIFVSMRRGGRAIYAIDVTTPTSPQVLWRKTQSDFAELGYSWSEPRVAKIAASADPVVIFGGGYDPSADDQLPTGTRSMGRAVFVLNSETGALIKSFTSSDHAELDASVPADVALVDRDDDVNGYVDRLYVVTSNGKIFRADISDSDASKWKLYHLATLSGSGTDARKFLYKADVVLGTAFDSVLVGSGDREKPFDQTVQNRFYMLKDRNVGLTVSSMTALTENDLVAANSVPVLVPEAKGGWYLPLTGAGEKVVGSSATVGGVTFFATNRPTPVVEGSCKANLGESKVYGVDYLNVEGKLDGELSEIRTGGGYIPSPVPVVVEIGGAPIEAIIMGTSVFQPPTTKYGQRYRTYWYKHQDRK